MTKKILVTGSEGYIGQHLCSLLEKQDVDLYKLDKYFEHRGPYMFEVDLTKISGVDLFFYDGPHEEDLTTRAVKYYSKAFADTCIMIFDDANWAGIVSGADTGIEQAGLRILYSKKMLNEQEDLSKWWNGLYIVVVQKNETSNIIS